jgi:hypothetical protein
MRKAYAILRAAKCSSYAAAGQIEKHHEREKEKYPSNPDIVRSRSHLNYHLVEPTRATYKEAIENRIEEAQEENPALIERSNSVRMVDVMITASPLWFEFYGWERERYFAAALRFVQNWVGERNIVSAVVHMDEKTPHMHLVFVPITKDNRLCAKDIMGGPKEMSKLQDRFFEAVSREVHDLDRGRPRRHTGRNHLTTQTLKEMNGLGNPDRRYAVVTELENLRRLRAKITPEMMERIKENDRRGKKSASRDREQSR